MCTAVPRSPSHRRRRARARVSEIVRHEPVPLRVVRSTKDGTTERAEER